MALLAYAAPRNMEGRQWDVRTAFLNGELEEEIYMKQPSGFEEPGGGGSGERVCLLHKSLYGLRQSPRQ